MRGTITAGLALEITENAQKSLMKYPKVGGMDTVASRLRQRKRSLKSRGKINGGGSLVNEFNLNICHRINKIISFYIPPFFLIRKTLTAKFIYINCLKNLLSCVLLFMGGSVSNAGWCNSPDTYIFILLRGQVLRIYLRYI